MAQLFEQKVKGSKKLWKVVRVRIKPAGYAGSDRGEIKRGDSYFYVLRRPGRKTWYVAGFENDAAALIFDDEVKKPAKQSNSVSTRYDGYDDWNSGRTAC